LLAAGTAGDGLPFAIEIADAGGHLRHLSLRFLGALLGRPEVLRRRLRLGLVGLDFGGELVDATPERENLLVLRVERLVALPDGVDQQVRQRLEGRSSERPDDGPPRLREQASDLRGENPDGAFALLLAGERGPRVRDLNLPPNLGEKGFHVHDESPVGKG
jgi:hypothetical protein